ALGAWLLRARISEQRLRAPRTRLARADRRLLRKELRRHLSALREGRHQGRRRAIARLCPSREKRPASELELREVPRRKRWQGDSILPAQSHAGADRASRRPRS